MSQSSQVKPCVKCGAQERIKSGACAPCKRERGRLRYRENPEKHKILTKRWSERNSEYKKQITREWRAGNPQRVRALSRKHGRISQGWAPGEHERAEEARLSVARCECCRSSDPRHRTGWKADHDHATGLFRGFLCHPCNVVMGFVEKHGLAQSADIAVYLASH